MFNATYIFIQRLNHREAGEGQYMLSVVEFVITAIIVAIIRNT